ncbi:hypothetical protein [Wolbachia endosymbiont (group A) of Gymnosoma rotundatum]|uniref:hypothetical protein n=1 Tax=Wolbachia endosymbiont (group A) of Gymnosoma rotundatum TaxID=2954016 RepID=UPI002227B288|nr:hypothetical protein [Wolbachia endosymbiont (group A) of Gymnosoma rotundatum]
MLGDIIKQVRDSDVKALSEIFSRKKIYRSVDGSKKNYKAYLADIVSENYGYPIKEVILPKEIIPNLITLEAFAVAHRKDPSISPILLKYFTHKNLLKEAKKDLNKINQKLQDSMNEEIKKLQEEQKMACKEIAELSGKEVNVKQSEELAKKSTKITETASRIEKIELCKEDIKNLLSGKKATPRTYPQKYYSILNGELTKVIEEKLKAYVKDDEADVKKIYQSLNNKAEKIKMLRGAKLLAAGASMAFFTSALFVGFLIGTIAGGWYDKKYLAVTYYLYTIAIMFSVSLTIAGVVHLANRHYEQSFVKEMENFVGEIQHVDKLSNTEDKKKLEQKEEDLSEKEKQFTPLDNLYPDLSQEFPENYKILFREPSSDISSALPISNIMQKKM